MKIKEVVADFQKWISFILCTSEGHQPKCTNKHYKSIKLPYHFTQFSGFISKNYKSIFAFKLPKLHLTKIQLIVNGRFHYFKKGYF